MDNGNDDDDDEDFSEVEYLAVEEINVLLSKLKNKDKDMVETILDQNNTLLEVILDMQWFMHEKGITPEQFRNWVAKKEIRTYH
jgi:hypothetical protein|tara:strand:+ start:40 stop:291 length:252 start_codon:yes stop_codon:yes gene_type:complete